MMSYPHDIQDFLSFNNSKAVEALCMVPLYTMIYKTREIKDILTPTMPVAQLVGCFMLLRLRLDLAAAALFRI